MFNRLFACITVALILSACTTAQSDRPNLRLRVLTYNIHHGEGVDGKFDYPRLAGVIKRARPDLVALQEVDVKTKRSRGVDQAAKLAELTGMHSFFAEAIPYQGGSYGNSLLTLAPVSMAYTESLPLPAQSGEEPRVVAIADLAKGDEPLPGPGIAFCGTHLSHQLPASRLAQVEEINKEVLHSPNLPTILAGDFNFTPDSEPYRAMIDAGWVDTAAAFGDPKPTYPSDSPRKRIDYVFVRPAEAWRVVDVQVLDEPVASDHTPVLVVLEYIAP